MRDSEPPAVVHLYDTAAPPDTGERFETLLSCRNVTIERIVSSDRPEPTLYAQAQDEWVMLVRGRARLEIDGTPVTLQPGDALFIPARTPHRVVETSAQPPCLWLAVHIRHNGA